MGDKKKRVICIVVLVWMLVLSYLLIKSFGDIENSEVLVPTGNVDIFEVGCACCCKDGDDGCGMSDDDLNGKEEDSAAKEYGGSEDVRRPTDEKDSSNKQSSDDGQSSDPEIRIADVTVYDDYRVWDNQDLRIFSNPAYEYRNVIAPGSYNSYAFAIRNKNDFDIVVDILLNEANNNNINMQYKLKNDNNYLLGAPDKYEAINGRVISDVEIPANGYKSYILDWKWVDSSNDAMVGFDINSLYKLSIMVGVK